MEVDEYILRHIDPEPDYLHRLYRDTRLRLNYGQMASGHAQGRLLKMLTQMIHPRLAVEIGTYSGYSALCIAEGLERGAELHTFEIYDEQEDFTRPWLEGSEYGDRIHLHIGDALRLVPQMDLRPDMAYVDGDKRQYTDYYDMLMQRMPSGSYIIADNTLWYGHVLEERTRESDTQTLGMKAFNDKLAADRRVEKVMLPVRDGLTLIRVK